MNILIPMAGAGSRFAEAGYTVHKPAIPTTDRRTDKAIPMVVAATNDLPHAQDKDSRIIYIDRDFHRNDGVEEEIRKFYPDAVFITIDYLTEGQASTCLLARDRIDNGEPLLIAGCDNGMVLDEKRFDRLCGETDALIFTYRNHELVLEKPEAHGWVVVDADENVVSMSVKKPISDNPLDDHAVVATFWFREGRIFVRAADKMIAENDRVNDEFYVDQVMQHVVELGYRAKVFEIERYIGWGTPKDHEEYQRTIEYWKGFIDAEGL